MNNHPSDLVSRLRREYSRTGAYAPEATCRHGIHPYECRKGCSPPGLEAANDIESALEVIRRFGGIDGAHHKQWVLDQVVRALTGDGYTQWVVEQKVGEDGPNTYEWDEGIAP